MSGSRGGKTVITVELDLTLKNQFDEKSQKLDTDMSKRARQLIRADVAGKLDACLEK